MPTGTYHTCPICEKELEYSSYRLDGFILMEEEYKCSEGHYLYSYETGYTTIRVGDKEWDWGYSISDKRRDRISSAINDECKRLRAS